MFHFQEALRVLKQGLLQSSHLRHCSNQTGPIMSTPIALPPKKHLAIVTCMDSRINPFTQLGLELGDAHIIRNAGGMARDAIRSLIISQRLLGTTEIAIYHHTGCGMMTFTGEELRNKVKESEADPERVKGIDEIDFMEFGDVSLKSSVLDDVQFLKDHPLLMKGTKITGYIHDVQTGKATQVA
ncbi:carbonic anhydrase [Mycena floridula]|nr:carbonic anhydrase [Mycena floridula]